MSQHRHHADLCDGAMLGMARAAAFALVAMLFLVVLGLVGLGTLIAWLLA